MAAGEWRLEPQAHVDGHVIDRVIHFQVHGANVAGVLSGPAHAQRQRMGVIIIVGGPQYRVGSHRQFVGLARGLAAGGWPCLRFDVRGMGDSEGSFPGFENIGEDIRAAIDTLLTECPDLQGVTLLGLCDAASAALIYLDRERDHRVRALCLLNPWVRTPETLAATHARHYYLSRLRERSFWLKVVKGEVGLTAWRGLRASLVALWKSRVRGASGEAPASIDFRARMARAAAAFPGAMYLGTSEHDLTAKEFLDQCQTAPEWKLACGRASTTIRHFDDADHTFSSRRDSELLLFHTLEWLGSCARPGVA